MKYIICGGGTSGHIMPAIAVAEALKKTDKEGEILFVGRLNGNENQAIIDHKYMLKEIEVYGLSRKIGIVEFKRLCKTLKSVKEAKKIIDSFKPDAVIGTGGYVCWPVISEASKKRIPCYLHESNSVIGLSAKTVFKKCRKVFTGFKNLEGVKDKKRLTYVGTPLRDAFKSYTKESARQRLGIGNGTFFILSFGGSGGAEFLNETLIRVLEDYSLKTPKTIHIHVSGAKYYERFFNIASTRAKKCIVPFIKNMPLYLSACDLLISRSGAMTITEAAYLRKPTIMIPSPNVAGNHQYKNAKIIADAGGTLLIPEKDLTPKSLLEKIVKIRDDKFLRNSLSANIGKHFQKNAADKISAEIISHLKNSLPQNNT